VDRGSTHLPGEPLVETAERPGQGNDFTAGTLDAQFAERLAGARPSTLTPAPPQDRAPVAERLPPAPGTATARILVVDDEIEIADSLAEFLRRKEGFRVEIVHDGHQAITYLEKSIGGALEIDLVLLDMRMPGLSGLDVLDWIRQHPDLRYTRVVLLTAAASNDEKVQALSAGADDYITKPYYMQELLARVKTILRTQQLEKQLHRQSRQLAALNRIGQAVAATLETSQVYQTAIRGVDAISKSKWPLFSSSRAANSTASTCVITKGQFQPTFSPPRSAVLGCWVWRGASRRRSASIRWPPIAAMMPLATPPSATPCAQCWRRR
jgi:DNA-binding response OmpR family regulator